MRLHVLPGANGSPNATRLVVMLLLLALSGCNTLTPQPPISANTLAIPGVWQANGKIALHDGQSFTTSVLRFRWIQHGQDYHTTLIGPLGLNRLLLKRQSGQLSLSRGGRLLAHADTAADAARKLQQHSGWILPIGQLPYWLIGQPAPGQPTQQLAVAAHGGTLAFIQSGWQLHYRYGDTHKTTTATLRPQKIIASQGEQKITVVVQHWK